MSRGGARSPSIRQGLLLYLCGCLLLVIICVAAVTYAVALRAANDAYDRSLLDPAIDIADNVRIEAAGARVDLPQKALEALVYDQSDSIIYQVRMADGQLVSGVDDLPPPPAMAAGAHRFFDAMYRGQKIRVAGMRTANGTVVQVGETLHKRHQLVGEILAAELLTTLVIGAGSVALAWVGIARGLRPLEQLRAEILQRSIRDLRPLPAGGAPAEIAPVVRAFNELLAQLGAANTLQQRFMANAAHQLRTPLSGLQMHLEILLRRPLDDEVRAEIDLLHIATVRASRLATQLLALAKAETVPGSDRSLEIIDLRDLGGAAARDWVPRALQADIDLGFSLEPAVVLGDRTLLPEALNNLIDNALRYTPRGGSVTVRTGCIDAVPYLSVEDTGPGIPAPERDSVLERFYRVAGTPGEGSGLGLAIVKEVVDRHAGELEIDSVAVVCGTCVRISFPSQVSETS